MGQEERLELLEKELEAVKLQLAAGAGCDRNRKYNGSL